MSGIDEQYGPLISNNVFHQIFRGLRFDFAEGVEERIKWLLDILPHTSIKDTKEMSGYLSRIMQEWKQRSFRGRDAARWDDNNGTKWIRDGPYCYMTPDAWIPDWKYLALFGIDGKAFYLQNYEESIRIYDLWKSRRLKVKEGE